MITFIFILPVMRKQLTLSRLRSAGQVVYNRKSIQLANKVKKLFTLSQNKEAFQSISPKLRFQCFYIWYAYFRMLPLHSFVDILNNLNLNNIDRSVTEKTYKSKRSLQGGLFGITISAIVAGIAAAASKAAVTTAAAATAIGSSTAASTIATSVAGGVAGVLATKATEAIIEEAT